MEPERNEAMTEREPTTRVKKDASASQLGQRRNLALEKGSVSYQQMRREIATAAGAVFFAKTFQGSSLADVAKALDIDRATLYYYFTNKQDILDEVVREAAETDVSFAEKVQASDELATDKLRRLIIGLMTSYATHYPLLYVYVRENLINVHGERSQWSNHMRNVNRRYDNAITSIVQEGIDDGTIRPLASARVLAFGIIGMVGWTNRWFVPDRSPESAETIGTAYAEMIVKGLAV